MIELIGRKVRTAVAAGTVTLIASATVWAAGPWSSAVSISSIEVDSTGTAGNGTPGTGTATYLTFSSTPTGVPACSTKTQYVAFGSAEHVKQVTAIASQAFLAGKQIRVFWDSTCESGGYARFMHISMP